MLPCVLWEDEDLLVVNKPAGWNTHAPSPFAGEGIYDWLRHREPRWGTLAIIHRLDKETSGVLVFAKTPQASRSLTQQFAGRAVRKSYLMLTDRGGSRREFTASSALVRVGDKYQSGPPREGAVTAETRFRRADLDEAQGRGWSAAGLAGAERLVAWEAEPRTGRTHQIRVHAAEQGMPILGDTLYGGTPAGRVYLHATRLVLQHPATGKQMNFDAPPEFGSDPRLLLRTQMIEAGETDGFRLVHGASDDQPGWYLERYADYLVAESAESLSERRRVWMEDWRGRLGARGVYYKQLNRQVGRVSGATAAPQLVGGEAAPERLLIRENGIKFELNLGQGYSVGLFLDQRDNRRRLRTGNVAAGFELYAAHRPDTCPAMLNAFAYTCGFSVCAASGGARTTSLDLSRSYLEWGKRNFAQNDLDPTAHEFIYGDAFGWLKRLAKKGRRFDVVLLDPPTFSRSKESGVFRAQRDYGELVKAALPVLSPGGVLFASTNAADWPPEDFLGALEAAVKVAGRRIGQQHYVPQPPDFPITRAEPGYLKTVWLRVD